MRSLLAVGIVLLFMSGCVSTGQMGSAMTTTAKVATTAPELAKQFNNVYTFLVTQKAVPDRTQAATKALAAMDAVAPLVQAGADSLKGDKFNWASFILQSALIVAQTMGYVLPLVL